MQTFPVEWWSMAQRLLERAVMRLRDESIVRGVKVVSRARLNVLRAPIPVDFTDLKALTISGASEYIMLQG
jgi:hypothetical protein